MTRNLPGCSVKKSRPSGANASDQGTVSPVATSCVCKSLSVVGGGGDGGGGVGGGGVGGGVGLVGEFGGAGFELVFDVLPQPTKATTASSSTQLAIIGEARFKRGIRITGG